MSFFAPPRRVETTVFTRLPDRFRKLKRSVWADANRDTLEVDSFLEGPSFDRQGRLYVTDIPFGRAFRIDPAGEWEQVTEYDGWPNGLKIHRDGGSSSPITSAGCCCWIRRTVASHLFWRRLAPRVSRASTILSSPGRARSISPTRGRPECTTRRAAFTA